MITANNTPAARKIIFILLSKGTSGFPPLSLGGGGPDWHILTKGVANKAAETATLVSAFFKDNAVNFIVCVYLSVLINNVCTSLTLSGEMISNW